MSSSEETKGPPISRFRFESSPLTLPDIKRPTGPPLMAWYLYPRAIEERHAREARQQERIDNRIPIMLANREIARKEAFLFSQDPSYHSTKEKPMGPPRPRTPPMGPPRPRTPLPKLFE